MTSGDVEGINLKARPLLERHKDAGVIVTPAVVINVELQFLGLCLRKPKHQLNQMYFYLPEIGNVKARLGA